MHSQWTYISMTNSKPFFVIILCVSAVAASGQTADSNAHKADNTKVNSRDRKAAEPTADQQKMNSGDRDLTKKIRQAIMADKSLSTYAHNIKIISQDGNVTLKGPVRSEDEKKSVISKATGVTGSADKITDQISVKQ